jgi:ATP-dependent DNA helicase DinG
MLGHSAESRAAAPLSRRRFSDAELDAIAAQALAVTGDTFDAGDASSVAANAALADATGDEFDDTAGEETAASAAAEPPPRAALDLTPPVFAPGGWLHENLGLQHRSQQASLAAAAARAFASDSPLLAEAGTGVGKSIAYLVPGLLHALDAGRQVVVSSNTILLQDQILHSDLAKCRALFEATPELRRFAGFKTALLVGRANYLCSTRLARAFAQHAGGVPVNVAANSAAAAAGSAPVQGELFDTTAQRGELQALLEWASRTETGLYEEIRDVVSPEVWDWVNADSSVCNPRNCRPDTCPHQRAKARIAGASIIIVNHALLLSLIAAGAGRKAGARGVLFPNDFLVIDEAHTLPAVATDHFGFSVSARAVERQLKMLWNPKRNRGFLSTYNKNFDFSAVMEAFLVCDEFFGEIGARVLGEKSILRLTRPDWIAPRLAAPLTRIIARLCEIARIETDRNRCEEIGDFRRRLTGYRDALNEAVALANVPDSVYWVERGGTAGRNVSVNSAPLDVAPLLREHLLERKTSVLMTSATLTDGADMRRFKLLTGSESAAELIELSPFDYRRNMEIYIAADTPAAAAERDDWLADVAARCAAAVPGGTLLLCTNHGDVRKLAAALPARLEALAATGDDAANAAGDAANAAGAATAAPANAVARPVLAQLAGTRRTRLVADFAAAGNAILIGTDSFWTGVDVPGPALSQVIMTKLPFENISHPVAEARAEWVESQGRSAFAELSLPAALIKFRQGLGRLIRKLDDRGRLVILDSRVLVKPYGRSFVAALPHPDFRRFTRATLGEVIKPYR